ncbi:hypothetical protein H2200_000315 [Cladophialophora chaetospira]|uniref:BTB domain-containing protein n=1 Tax=Cladophialophora chaetospira TaxID=386627 RepID=A0AA38XP19_9EURO|nr:hypothetical protein H2200_000315 [Cladophialophora chaetospira]
MSTTEQVNFSQISESRPVRVLVIHREEETKRDLFLHPTLLGTCSPKFADDIQGQGRDSRCDLDSPYALVLEAPRWIFEYFCNWLHRGRMPEESDLSRLHSLLEFARREQIEALKKDLTDQLQQHCKKASDIMISLRSLVGSTTDVEEELPGYLLKKTAFKMTTKGYVNFIEAADGEFEEFISMKPLESRHKKEYIAKLWHEVSEANYLQSRGTLVDPAMPT